MASRGSGDNGKIPLKFDKGLVTARDPATLETGELQVATGCEYRIGNPAVYKTPGRSTAATIASSASVTGLQYLQYDTGSDKFVATSGTAVYENDGGAFTAPGSTFTMTAVASFVRTVNSPPSFVGFADRWLMVNGVDVNYIREPNAPTPVNSGYFGNWRRAGMLPASGTTLATPNATVGSTSRDFWDAGSGGFTTYIGPLYTTAANGTTILLLGSARQAFDSVTGFIETYAFGTATTSATTKQVTFTYGGGGTAGATHSLEIVHAGAALPPDDDVDRTHGEVSAARHKVEVSINSGSTYTVLSDRQGTYAATSSSFKIVSGTTLNNIRVRCTTTWVRGNGGTGRVYDLFIRNGSGSATVYTTTNPIYYLVTERYYDGDGLVHESRGTYVSAGVNLVGHAGVDVTVPTTKANAMSTEFVFYRSIDEIGGGYPNLWEIGAEPISTFVAGGGVATTWLDTLDETLTTVDDKFHLYDIITVLYPTGESLDFPINDPPPLAKGAVQFQGSMVYLPVQIPRKVWYSIPTSLSAAAAEQVPAIYNLEFITASNDTVISAALCNGGKTMVVFFANYAMMVSYLPQANDPGVFDTRVKEFVSNMRGASGPRCACDFTTPDGAHLAAAVDSLGLWATDGVSMVKEASSDFAWQTTFTGIDLSTGELRNNPSMRRLEFIYTTDAGTTWYELRFFYGEMKPNGQPKITGPDLAGYRTKHYSFLSTQYRGWSGSKTADGKVFYERGADSDASNGYNASGHVPFVVTTGDMYTAGLSGNVMATFGYPKFETGAKTINFVGTFRRDGFASAQTKTKTFVIGTQRKIYWHYYADRHNVSVQDITATSLPALVGYELDIVGLGDGREQ